MTYLDKKFMKKPRQKCVLAVTHGLGMGKGILEVEGLPLGDFTLSTFLWKVLHLMIRTF
jgi:hypothetical protein